MEQERQQEIEALKEALKNFIDATEELNRSYNALKDEVRRLSEELQQQKDLLTAVIESLRDGVIAVDPSGRVIAVNQRASELLGVELGKDISPLLPNLKEELEFYTLTGERKVIRVGRFPLIQNGKTSGEVITLRDITRERELEEENKRRERLSAMGKMAASIAHEIRNPLGSIELFAGLLKRGGTPQEQKRWAESIIKVVKSINNIVSNMLIFTRPIYLEPAITDMKNLAEECIQMALPALREKEIEISLEGEGSSALVDRELMKQAILNLIINSVQAIKDKGKLTITVSEEDSYCVIKVKDTGCGIPQHIQKRIFDPFFTTKNRGTGLGLAIVHRIVEAHRGSISLYSVPGETIFTIRIPKDG